MEELLDEALNQLDKLLPGKIFRVKDLFRYYQWKELSTFQRAQVCRSFDFAMRNRTDIDPAGVTPEGDAKYRKL